MNSTVCDEGGGGGGDEEDCPAESEACFADDTCISVLPQEAGNFDFDACMANELCGAYLQCHMDANPEPAEEPATEPFDPTMGHQPCDPALAANAGTVVLLHLPCRFSRCFNSAGVGVSAFNVPKYPRHAAHVPPRPGRGARTTPSARRATGSAAASAPSSAPALSCARRPPRRRTGPIRRCRDRCQNGALAFARTASVRTVMGLATMGRAAAIATARTVVLLPPPPLSL